MRKQVVLLLCLLCLFVIEAWPQASKRSETVVVISLKKGDPLEGRFIKADSDSIQVEVEGHVVTIGMDNLLSLGVVRYSPGDKSATSSKEPEAATRSRDSEVAEPALKALKGMAAALEIGLNLRDYGNRLIDVKIAVDEAERKMESSKLKIEIRAAFHDYETALWAWDMGIKYHSGAKMIFTSDPMIQELMKRYPDLKPIQPSGILRGTEYDRPYFNLDTLLSGIWASARNHIDGAAAIISVSSDSPR